MAKTYNTTSHLMDNNVYIFLHIKLVTSLSTVDLTPNFSESNDIYRYYKWYISYVMLTPTVTVL